MTSDKEEARPPGEGAGLNGDERPGGRDVVPRVAHHPVAHASLYAPADRRTWWWYAMHCPHCGAGHFGRARTEDGVTGVRRTGCGRRVVIVVARTYSALPMGRLA